MEPTKKTKTPFEKATTFTLEEVTNMQNQYNNQLRQYEDYIKTMQEELKNKDLGNMLKRIDVLFGVLHHSDKLSEKLVLACAKELEELILLDEEPIAKMEQESQE
jgi:hypothetical protein